MKCDICGKEYSQSVFIHHYNWCKEQIKETIINPKDLTYKELQVYYTEKTGNKSVGIKKTDMLKELGVT